MAAKKAHFIGISGKGMSAAAKLLQDSGWEVGGSDEECYSPVSDYLHRSGIPFVEGYDKKNIPHDADLIVIGKNAKLVPETNEEVRAAFASGKKVSSYPEVLRDLAGKTENIVVAGSYGKSTTTALLAWCLTETGKDPNYFIGEVVREMDEHAHLGSGKLFILEGDEYPSANWDETPKFLYYNPHSVLLTSATHDHINVYPTHEDYLAPFKKLIAALPKSGLLVVNAGEKHAFALSKEFAGSTVTYGMTPAARWHPKNIHYGMPTVFDLYDGNKFVTTLRTSLLGAHNIENIVGAGAMLLEKNLLTPQELAAAVETFQGVKRRMESLAPLSSVPVFEGFGSSYEKARSAIAAMRLHFPKKRLVVVFEPHTFTWRNRASLSQYDKVFEGAQLLCIYEPAIQGASTHAQLTQEEIVKRVADAGFITHSINADALQDIGKELREDDCILLLASGDMGGLLKTIPAMVEQKFPKPV